MTPHCHIARITLEGLTPISIGTGKADGVFDLSLVRDANGLPAIPGSSIAGVLRHAYARRHGEDRAQALFGHASGPSDGAASAIELGWAHIHDSEDRPVDGLALTAEDEARLASDPLLALALNTAQDPLARDRVRLDARGTADDRGKFDRPVLPAGYRFSFDMRLWSPSADDGPWRDLLALLSAPDFRLGGGTRTGLGAVKIVKIAGRGFDLRKAEDAQAFRQLPTRLDRPTALPAIVPPASAVPPARALELEPTGFWRIGQGRIPLARDASEKTADHLPITEQRVVWDQGLGRLQTCLLVPASSIKGALRHRVAYHDRIRLGAWIDADPAATLPDGPPPTPAEEELFGQASHERGEKSEGAAGKILIDDHFIPLDARKHHLLMHNSIDRFTGGVRHRLLFMEELLWNVGWRLEIRLLGEVSPAALEVLDRALTDLAEGRLALGAGQSKGHGFFKGRLEKGEQA